MKNRFSIVVAALAMLIQASSAMARNEEPSETAMIKIDGSSTVYPITEAVAEEYSGANRNAKATIGISGTGGGFKKFCNAETDISDASRPIKEAETQACKEKGIAFIELPIAYDAITVVVNPKNTWAGDITLAELKKLWEPDAQGKITRWNQIRPEWPNQPIKLYGAGTDSGTFDYFTEAVVGKEKASRGDYTSSEDDNVIVQGVSRDINALGYFGLAYYEENQKKLKAVSIQGVSPSKETVVNGSYKPLSRPLFIYVKKDPANSKAVTSFVNFYLQNAKSLAEEVGYVPLQDTVYALAAERFKKGIEGSVFGGHGSQVGLTLDELLKRES